ncbi:hypothetical protein [Deinococcus roseus]|uniref:Uncharacterized protein n=1 Tax=Deinococcus roseus TaxID=392414 RepID=A0ABQ2CZB0_9DEIO|nr:hypothetical protein [Deinococcus roseus]GGJ35765.1 hypothetical protein GCM10008938_22370 [Deinococcus roseus]
MTQQLPFALDDQGRVSHPLTASHKGFYTCLECQGRLRLRRHLPGADRMFFVAHFQHAGQHSCKATAETVALQAARRLLKARVLQDLQNSGKIRLLRPCRSCQTGVEETLGIPDWAEVQEDVRVQLADRLLRLDGAVLAAEQVKLGWVLQPAPVDLLPMPFPVWELDFWRVLQHKPLWVADCPAEVLCADCERKTAQQMENPADEASTPHSRVSQAWNQLTSRKAIETLTQNSERTPRERAVQVLRQQGVNYRDLKDLGFVTLLIPCPDCGEEVVFATSKPAVVRQHKDQLGSLVTWLPGQRRHMHVCSHCGAQHPEEWFWEAWQHRLGERV